ncbi:PH domain-containing protein [Kitasatospora kazusensis]|uniref:PH domain-containing protein n=1 Tax=Kitasatospora kazusensis TaxID=407974 RepID=A0ABN2YQJ4_9ACTN
MTESDGTPDPGTPEPDSGADPGAGTPAASGPKAATPAASGPKYADRVYRSVPGVISGVLLLAVAAWLIIDAVLTGSGRTPWIALAAAPLFAFPVIAYTLRPVVLSNDDRLLVRNPIRTVHAPWASVEGFKAGYSVELFAAGKSYQVWAVPVSLKQRKRATARATRAAAGGDPEASRTTRARRPDEADPTRAWSDQVVDSLQETAERNAGLPGAAGPVTVTWCWWVIAPTLAGLVALAALLATG